MNMRKLIAAAAVAASAMAANASSITIDSVTQRWPWNNKVDITYTVKGGQVASAGEYCGLRFHVATASGTTYDFEGYSVGASAESGVSDEGLQHTVTWIAPSGIKLTDCTMTATLFTTNVPSGNDYMIIDLASGEVYYEGLMRTQEESNDRYNTGNTYKTAKMVLRKVAKTSESAFPNGYPVGHDDFKVTHTSTNKAWTNPATNWIVKTDYYIGIHLVSQAQYKQLGLTNPSKFKSDCHPVETVSWNAIRDSAKSSEEVAPSATGGFLARLNNMTKTRSGIMGLDLPTELMWEIAARAGRTTRYWWGADTWETETAAQYVTYGGNSNSQTADVGARLPNAWGLYDVSGNLWELTRDTANGPANLANASDPFTPTSGDNPTKSNSRGGSHWQNTNTSQYNWCVSTRNLQSLGTSNAGEYNGFRVSYIVK